MVLDNSLQNYYSKFTSSLITAVRKISLYPLNHPSVVTSLDEMYTFLRYILDTKKTLNLSITPSHTIVINEEEISDKTQGLRDSLAIYFKKLNIESIVFNPGVTQKEIAEFIRLVLSGHDLIEEGGDINKILSNKDIQNIKIEQVAYVKIKKNQEALILEKEDALLEKLKSRIKDFSQGKITGQQEIQNLEKEIFDKVTLEFKEKKALGASLKTLLKKFLQHNESRQEVLDRLKAALLDLGLPKEDVDKLIKKISEGLVKKPKEKLQIALGEVSPEIKKEHIKLQERVMQLEQEITEQAAQAEELKKQNQVLFREKQRIDNIVRHMAEGMVVIGPQGEILMANPTAESLLGITESDIGKPIKEVVRDEHLLALVKSISSDQDAVMEQDIELFSPAESTKKVLRTSSAVVADPNGKTVGMVTILNDITKQKEIEKLKSDFLACVSHELRTPLVAMEKSVSLLLNKSAGEISSDQEQFLAITERNLKRLNLLITDLLDLSKLEAGKMQVKLEPSSIDKVINESASALKNWANTKSINIEKRIQEGLPQLNMDPNRIIQVLNNLIGNAIKFTPNNGKITVAAIFRPEGKEIEVSIQDTGIGIAKENLPKIFDKFYQIGERTPTDISGTGIGLSIAKEIVQLHGGKIWAEGEHGQGAKFSFTLPLNTNSGG